MSQEPHDYATVLERLKADPRRSMRELCAVLRDAGHTGGDDRMRAGVRLFKARHDAAYVLPSPEWVSRAEAQEILGLRRARVDQLRRAGVLDGERNPHTGTVRLRRASVEAERDRRAGA